MDAFAWFLLISKEAIVSLVYTPNNSYASLVPRTSLASTMASTMWCVSLQCLTDDFEVLLNWEIPDKHVKNVEINLKSDHIREAND